MLTFYRRDVIFEFSLYDLNLGYNADIRLLLLIIKPTVSYVFYDISQKVLVFIPI